MVPSLSPLMVHTRTSGRSAAGADPFHRTAGGLGSGQSICLGRLRAQREQTCRPPEGHPPTLPAPPRVCHCGVIRELLGVGRAPSTWTKLFFKLPAQHDQKPHASFWPGEWVPGQDLGAEQGSGLTGGMEDRPCSRGARDGGQSFPASVPGSHGEGLFISNFVWKFPQTQPSVLAVAAYPCRGCSMQG